MAVSTALVEDAVSGEPVGVSVRSFRSTVRFWVSLVDLVAGALDVARSVVGCFGSVARAGVDVLPRKKAEPSCSSLSIEPVSSVFFITESPQAGFGRLWRIGHGGCSRKYRSY